MEEYVQQDLFTENETVKARKNRKRNGEKRVQVSVYLEPENYEGIRLMSANMNKTISDILEIFAENFVNLNQEAIQKMKSTWGEIQVRFK